MILLSVVAFAYVLLFLVAAALRANYPLQLEWLEGGVLDAVGRCMRHQGIYVKPTHNWVPFVYMPFYYYVSAIICKMAGFTFAPLRWLSTVCTVGCFLVQGRMAARLGRSWAAGLIAAGLFASLYATLGCWYDLARVDMLFTFLTLVGIYYSWRGLPSLAALAFALSFGTKQTGLIIGICVLAHEYRRPRFLIRGIGTFGICLLLINAALTKIYGPWYAYYTRYLPAHQGLEPRGLYWFLVRDLLYPSALAIGIIIAAAINLRQRPQSWTSADKQTKRLILAATLGLTIGCFASRLHSGGSVNVTIPLSAWLAILFGAAFVSLKRCFEDQRKFLWLAAAATLQFAVVARSPLHYIPTRSTKQAAAKELQQIAEVPGDLYVFNNSADLALIGKRSFANSAAIFDVLRADHGAVGQQLNFDVQSSLQRGEYSGLIIGASPSKVHPLTDAPSGLDSVYMMYRIRIIGNGMPAHDAFASDPIHMFPRMLILRNH